MEGFFDALGAVSLAILILIGLVAGWLAAWVTGRNVIAYMALGVAGAVALPFVLALLGVGVLAAGGLLLLLAVATSPYWLELPRPRGALEVATAVLVDASGAPPVAVDLPHSWPRRAGELDYQLNFELAAVPAEPLYLFIPMLAQRAVVSIGGHQLADTGNRSIQRLDLMTKTKTPVAEKSMPAASSR